MSRYPDIVLSCFISLSICALLHKRYTNWAESLCPSNSAGVLQEIRLFLGAQIVVPLISAMQFTIWASYAANFIIFQFASPYFLLNSTRSSKNTIMET